MALILNIETTTTNCSVSLSKDGETLVLKEQADKGYSHGEKLHLFIDNVFKQANIEPKDIDAIAVSKGPGSYTGLRIGVASAKGLAYALGKPLISVSTLQALALQVEERDGIVIPVLDARRMEVYAAVFNSENKEVREIKAEILQNDSYHDYLENGIVYFIGNAVEKTKTVITHPNARFIDDKLPSASTMGIIAEMKYKKSDIEDVAYFEPFYLKDFVAIKSKKF
ncbi:tRNA (adenosine(37)-N6)-threonylcarbamoyltransferase complex dimerization subunit type 1 TsaB [Winogradskyella maritima]|uniref:tRNA (Adenosine(37)-N6)-threonylcarbamoyltransferase complex dimerization subunit type 1 TsaB n=1 Tax=Winogradskyella maritima TaxID=1517766 RepID=A0ABV8AG25_9FLAO|nr:tRNA (adenosine(37)-N6)-threonylcarbamoyltransferase complex dimerization subunit type 1 TsaB [Winogradskyella maritima]